MLPPEMVERARYTYIAKNTSQRADRMEVMVVEEDM
jgi:hypothetical protein